MNPFGRHLEKIGNKITINDKDRQVAAKDYEKIRNHVLEAMKNVDPIFHKMFGGFSLFGSFSNNVRINYPSEFDVIFILNMPYSKCIFMEQDQDRPGFVRLDFEDVMEKLKESANRSGIYDHLNDMVDVNNNYLRRGNLQRWLEKIIDNGLNKSGKSVRGCCGDKYTLIYTKRGLAHTIYAKCETNMSISIDFIPAIKFSKTEWMNIRKYDPFKNKCNEWFAIPKPTPGPKFSRKYAFMICNPKVEHELLLRKQNLKVVFRLLKSLRNKYGMQRLKSYFITTAFLWEIENQVISFWNNSVDYLLVHMLDVISDYFENGELPFFWDKDLNLLDVLSDEEIEDYYEKLCKAFNTLHSYQHQPLLTYGRVESHFKMQ